MGAKVTFHQLRVATVTVAMSVLPCLSAMAGSGNATSYDDYVTRTELTDPPLELANHDGDCMIRVGTDGQWQAVGIDGPCGFVRRGTPKAQSYVYEDVGRVFLIAGPVIQKHHHMTDEDEDPPPSPGGRATQCSDQGRPLIFNDGELVWRDKRGTRGVSSVCHEGGPDEKIFYMFAHPPPQEKDRKE